MIVTKGPLLLFSHESDSHLPAIDCLNWNRERNRTQFAAIPFPQK